MRTALDIALSYYERHGCIAFWNPRDITDENLRTDIPDAEALLIEPGNISSCEVQEGQYLVMDCELQPYDPYPGHEGVDAVVRGAQMHALWLNGYRSNQAMCKNAVADYGSD